MPITQRREIERGKELTTFSLDPTIFVVSMHNNNVGLCCSDLMLKFQRMESLLFCFCNIL